MQPRGKPFSSFVRHSRSISERDIWKRNFNRVEQLFDYGSNVIKVMYTANIVETLHLLS